MKWRRACPATRSLSLPDHIPSVPPTPLDSAESFFPSRKPPGPESTARAEEKPEEESKSDGELRLWDYRLLKVFFVLICFLVVSSSYLAFRISRLEQQLCTLSWDGPVPEHSIPQKYHPSRFRFPVRQILDPEQRSVPNPEEERMAFIHSKAKSKLCLIQTLYFSCSLK